MREPQAGRPVMPAEYGILPAGEGTGLLPWSWAVERLGNARAVWLATVRPDGRPHVMPVWGIWMGDRYAFSTSPQSRKARNLAGNPHCVVSTEGADEGVVLEGSAEEITDAELIREFQAAYQVKYGEEVDASQGAVYGVRPAVVFGFVSDPARWNGSITRWRFPGA